MPPPLLQREEEEAVFYWFVSQAQTRSFPHPFAEHLITYRICVQNLFTDSLQHCEKCCSL